jgi:hypothetical protein
MSSSPRFYLKTEAEFSFRNVVVLLFYNLDYGQSPNEQFRRNFLLLRNPKVHCRVHKSRPGPYPELVEYGPRLSVLCCKSIPIQMKPDGA